MSVTIYGASDDCIEVEGDVTEEFYLQDDDNGDYLAFSNGVILRIAYTGVWRITPVAQPSLSRVHITQAPEDDDENCSDRAEIFGNVKWVVHGINYARGK